MKEAAKAVEDYAKKLKDVSGELAGVTAEQRRQIEAARIPKASSTRG